MTCWTGSSLSSAAEIVKDDCSSSLSVGSVARSFSNSSSGMSGRIFLPCASTITVSSPTGGTSRASARSMPTGIFDSSVDSTPFLAGAFFAAVFLAVVLDAVLVTVASVLAGERDGVAFLAGVLAVADFLAAVLRSGVVVLLGVFLLGVFLAGALRALSTGS